MIHVGFGLHDRTGLYSKLTGTAIASIFENAKVPPQSISIHVLHDNTLANNNRDKFSQLAGKYEQIVKLYNVEEICPDKVQEMVDIIPEVRTSRVSIGAFYRLLIPQLLSSDIEKCIYFDSDMIVNFNIAELWQIELGDKPLGAVPEDKASSAAFKHYGRQKYLIHAGFVDYADYFNSGVLMMNLNYLRNVTETLKEGIRFRAKNPQCSAFDQDILNYLFSKNYLKLPDNFDQFIRSERLKKDTKNKIRQVAYHYVKDMLRLDLADVFNRLWMSYFLKTPWFEANSIGRLWTEFERMREGMERQRLKLSAGIIGRTRAFFVAPKEIESARKNFEIRVDEMIILAEGEESFQKLLNTMKDSKGKSIFFIMTEKFLGKKFPFEKLTKSGFVNDKDFLRGWELLSEAKGKPFVSHSLVMSM